MLKEMSLVQEYLSCYNSLTDPKASKQANRRLIEIQSSTEAWGIAEALIVDSQSQRRIHGCQLLSKRLSNPLPAQITPQSIANFVYSQGHKTKLHWLCIAKAVLHINSASPMQLEMLKSEEERLALLREMPTAVVQTHPATIMDSHQLLNLYLQANKEMLLRVFDTHADLVIDVLECFINDGIRLKSQQLLYRLLQYDGEIAGILETILRREHYPQLMDVIVAFLKRVEDNPDYFQTHISFYRNHYKYLSDGQFGQMISFVLSSLKSIDESQFGESYYFWYDILMDHQIDKLSPEKKRVFEEAMAVLWRMVCSKCVLNQLPNHKNIPDSTLSLDADDDGGVSLREPLQSNRNVQKFREFSGDFLSLCITALGGEESPFVQQVNSDLQAIAKGSVLDLQLAIFVLSTISEMSPAATKHSHGAVAAILRRENDLNQYLCGRVIDLIGKLVNLFTQSRIVLSPCLNFLLKCLQYEALAPPASESCCELLEETIVDETFILSQELEAFLGHLYELFFIDHMAERTRQNLAKAMVVFIIRFKAASGDYMDYLRLFSHRIQDKTPEVRATFIEAAITAQFWVNIHQEQKYLPVFEEFLSLHANFMLESILNAQDKTQFTSAVNLLNYSLKTNAVSSTIDTWIYIINEVMTKFVNASPPLPLVLTPLINLTKAVVHLDNEDLITKIAGLLSYWATSSISLLGDIQHPKVQFNISTNVVQIHLLLLQLYQKRQDLVQASKYSASNMLSYICNTIDYTEFWEYDLYKTSLAYLTLAIRLGSPVEHILIVLFRNYKKFAETLWSSVEPMLFAAYKSSGSGPILKTLQQVNSVLNRKNPLTDLLVNALANSEGKTIKNIFLCLS